MAVDGVGEGIRELGPVHSAVVLREMRRKLGALAQRERCKALEMGDDSAGGCVEAGPVEEVPGVHLEQAAWVEVGVYAADVALDVVEDVAGEGAISRELEMFLGPA